MDPFNVTYFQLLLIFSTSSLFSAVHKQCRFVTLTTPSPFSRLGIVRGSSSNAHPDWKLSIYQKRIFYKLSGVFPKLIFQRRREMAHPILDYPIAKRNSCLVLSPRSWHQPPGSPFLLASTELISKADFAKWYNQWFISSINKVVALVIKGLKKHFRRHPLCLFESCTQKYRWRC